MTDERPTGWTEWYRFACRTLELSPVEAATYATARFVEEENRRRLRSGAGQAPRDRPAGGGARPGLASE